MIVIKVELWPKGSERLKKLLAISTIANDGSGSTSVGNYGYKLFGANGRTMKVGRVEKFRRLEDHVWKLIAKVLKDAYPSE